MIHPYPSPDRAHGAPPVPEPPAPVRAAVIGMYVGAIFTALSVIADLATLGSIRSALQHARPGLTPTQLHSAVTDFVTADVLIAVIGVGLWVSVALAARAGKSWVRLAAGVLFGLDTVLLAIGSQQAAALATMVVSLLVWLIALGVIVLLWRRESRDFFTSASARQGP